MIRVALVCLLWLGGCERATPKTLVYSEISARIVHLSNGDSVEWQLTVPAEAAGSPTGLLVEYYPFRPNRDTTVLRQDAHAFFPIVWREVATRSPGFIVLRAVNLRAAERTGVYQIQNFGVVFEPRDDGCWYEYQSHGPPVAGCDR